MRHPVNEASLGPMARGMVALGAAQPISVTHDDPDICLGWLVASKK